MKITLKSFQLVPSINFLSGLSLKGKQSRARMKLMNKLDEKRAEIVGDINAIEHEKGSSQHDSETSEILNEYVTIDLTEYDDKMAVLTDALENYDGEISGKDASAHDLLLDALESAIEPQMQEVG